MVQYKRLIGLGLIVAFLLLIQFIIMQFTDAVNWSLFDFLIMGAVLFGVGLAYELVGRRSEKILYRAAFGVGLAGAFLLLWVNGAVGIIGNEDQTANYLYGAVFLVGFIGSLITRFQARGMSMTLFAAAFIQMLIPVIALFLWPQISWGGAGIAGVFTLNAFFAMLFVISGLLFRRASESET